MPAFYDPPYESPIEEGFALNVIKYLKETVQLEKQVECKTLCGGFRIDFVCAAEKRIGIECDGKEYHDKNRDEWRDAILLGDNRVDAIYRFRGQDLHYHMEDTLWVFSKCEPELISERGHRNLDILSSDNVKRAFLGEYREDIEEILRVCSGSEPELTSERRQELDLLISNKIKSEVLSEYGELIWLPAGDERNDHSEIVIKRKTREIPPGRRAHWKYLYQKALEFRGHDLEGIMDLYDRNYSIIRSSSCNAIDEQSV